MQQDASGFPPANGASMGPGFFSPECTHEQGAAIGRELHGMPAPMRALVIRLANIGLASVLESAIDAEAEQ